MAVTVVMSGGVVDGRGVSGVAVLGTVIGRGVSPVVVCGRCVAVIVNRSRSDWDGVNVDSENATSQR